MSVNRSETNGNHRSPRTRNIAFDWIPVLVLCAVTFVVYGRVLGADFVAFDDGAYVTHNRHVPNGITWDNLRWAATTGETATWQPLTLFSHMLDVELFGLWPGGHHLSGLLLHLANTLLLFVVLRRMTGDRGPSLFVAAVFALHPAHVESVAWVSERKDVLSALFWMLTLLAYAWYVRRRRIRSYLVATLFFALGLMAKPMLVTLPCVMLLLDYWPLRRIGTAAQPFSFTASVRLALEKLPWFAMAAASSALTLVTQQQTESVVSMDNLPLGLRVSNALMSYVRYLGEAIWPAKLAVFYPFPFQGIPLSHLILAGLLLAVVTAAALYAFRRAPYLTVGWFWYVGTLVPVIGFVQIGAQAMADRYTYIPYVGLAMIPAWGVPALVARWSRPAPGATLRKRYRFVAVAACAVCALWTWRTFVQVGTWHDTESLFRNAAEVTENNALALSNLGMALNGKGKYEQAIPYLERARELDEHDGSTLFNLALAHEKLGHLDAAIALYRQALVVSPTNLEAHNNLALCLLRTGHADEAVPILADALQIQPHFADAAANYGAALIQVGRVPEALAFLRDAVHRFSDNVSVHINLGIAYAASGDPSAAIREFETALELEPENKQARMNLQILRGE